MMLKLKMKKVMELLTVENHKTVKGEKLGILTGILYLAPANLSGWEVCPSRSPGCTSSCLFTAGRGAFSSVQKARLRKTTEFFQNREEFLKQLVKDITSIRKKALKNNMKPAIRLNGTSDIEWTRFGIMEQFPDVQFYDYTKVFIRLLREKPDNYHLTFSMNENNKPECMSALSLGYNVAIVFNRKNPLPEQWEGYKVVDGDQSDARFIDPQGVVVGLKAKGKAKQDGSGFVLSQKLQIENQEELHLHLMEA